MWTSLSWFVNYPIMSVVSSCEFGLYETLSKYVECSIPGSWQKDINHDLETCRELCNNYPIDHIFRGGGCVWIIVAANIFLYMEINKEKKMASFHAMILFTCNLLHSTQGSNKSNLLWYARIPSPIIKTYY